MNIYYKCLVLFILNSPYLVYNWYSSRKTSILLKRKYLFLNYLISGQNLNPLTTLWSQYYLVQIPIHMSFQWPHFTLSTSNLFKIIVNLIIVSLLSKSWEMSPKWTFWSSVNAMLQVMVLSFIGFSESQRPSSLSSWFMSVPLSYICVLFLFGFFFLFQLNSTEWQLSPGTTRREINLCKPVIWGSDDMVPWKHHTRSCQQCNPISTHNFWPLCVFIF